MGLFDVISGKRKLKQPAPDRLFAMSTAYVTLQTELELQSRGVAGIVFQALDTADFNEILRRANPGLAAANKVITILRRQKTALATVLDETDPIVSKLAANGNTFRRLVDEADQTTQNRDYNW